MNKPTREELLSGLEDLISEFRDGKPDDRSGMDRAYAVAITMLEKAIAYFDYWTRDNDELS